ncbi:MAG: DUF427 domain-containing protein [Alphaproteobacteria bacterium]
MRNIEAVDGVPEMAMDGMQGEASLGVLERDGYRVELRPSGARLQVRWAGRLIAETRAPIRLHESGYVPTWYIPRADVDPTVVRESAHRSYCPYKGEARYWTLAAGDRVTENAAWYYPDPFPGLERLKDYVAFYADRVDSIVEVDGARTIADAMVPTAGGAGGPVFQWLLRDAWRLPTARDLSDSFVRLLRAEDPDLVRFFVGIYVVHPMVRAMGFSWETGSDAVQEFDAPHTTAPSEDWVKSPLRPLMEHGRPEIRIRIDDDAAIASYPLLQRLRGLGATEYLALPMPHGNRVDAVALATMRPSGFDPALVEGLRTAAPLLGRLYALHGLDRTAHTLLDTYIGRQASERVFYGQVKRGDGEDIRAAIWFCDLRQFTQHSERLPRADLIRLLNDYFSMITEAVRRNGGEVLKFIGDAVLAIFPIGFNGDVGAICRAAYRAALDARTAVDAFNQARHIERAPPIDFGVSLHIGDVLYGNIGAPDRLDFTVIGPAVNLVTRIEGLTAILGEPLLMSQAFVEAAAIPARALGAYTLKGINAPQAVFAAESATISAATT